MINDVKGLAKKIPYLVDLARQNTTQIQHAGSK